MIKNKLYVFGYLARNVLYCLLVDNRYKEVVKKFEYNKVRLTKAEEAILNHLLEEEFLNVELVLKTALNIKLNLKEIKEDHKKIMNTFYGNRLEKRKHSDSDERIKIVKLIKVFEQNFKGISGIEKKACEIVNFSQSRFSKWKNTIFKNSGKKENLTKYLLWQKDISENERAELIKIIADYLNK